MKTKHGILFSFVALLMVTMFTFSGCKDEEETPADTILTGTTWENTDFNAIFKYVGPSTWQMMMIDDPTVDLIQGYGTYTVAGTTVTMSAGGETQFTGTLNSASAPTSMDVVDFGTFTKDEEEAPPPADTVLTGTTWENAEYSAIFKYVGPSTWQMMDTSISSTIDQIQGYGTYTVAGTAVTMSAGGETQFTGTLDSASAPTSMDVVDFGTFTKD
jgi:hypothetical protein